MNHLNDSDKLNLVDVNADCQDFTLLPFAIIWILIAATSFLGGAPSKGFAMLRIVLLFSS